MDIYQELEELRSDMKRVLSLNARQAERIKNLEAKLKGTEEPVEPRTPGIKSKSSWLSLPMAAVKIDNAPHKRTSLSDLFVGSKKHASVR